MSVAVACAAGHRAANTVGCGEPSTRFALRRCPSWGLQADNPKTEVTEYQLLLRPGAQMLTICKMPLGDDRG